MASVAKADVRCSGCLSATITPDDEVGCDTAVGTLDATSLASGFELEQVTGFGAAATVLTGASFGGFRFALKSVCWPFDDGAGFGEEAARTAGRPVPPDGSALNVGGDFADGLEKGFGVWNVSGRAIMSGARTSPAVAADGDAAIVCRSAS